MLINALTQ